MGQHARTDSDLAKWDVDPMPTLQKHGLTAVVVVAALSVIATTSLFAFLSYRFIFWRAKYSRYIGYNQYVVLIYNLILADLMQSIAFILSVEHVRREKITASSAACFAQGLLLQIGDPASGIFVFAISLHTFLLVTMRHKLGYRAFVTCVIGVWCLIALLVLVPTGLYGRYAYVPSGAWCWISADYEPCRLWLHYIWIFISEFGTISLYAIIVLQLRRRISESTILGSAHHQSLQRLRRVVGYMVLYPIAYVILSLPLAAGRMSTMQGHPPNMKYFCVAGAFMTSSGLVDVFLYTLTRRSLLVDSETSQVQRSRSRSHSRDNRSRYGKKSGGASKEDRYGHNFDLTTRTEVRAGDDIEVGGVDVLRSVPDRSDDIFLKDIASSFDAEMLPVGTMYQETTIEVTTEPAYPPSDDGNSHGPEVESMSGSERDSGALIRKK